MITQIKVIPTLADAPLLNLNSAQKVQKPLVVLYFWHDQHVAPPKFCQAVCLERSPVRWSIFIQTRESYWHLSTSWRNRIILSAVYRVSSPATLPVLHARELARERGAEWTTGWWSKSILGCRDTVFQTNLTFHFGLCGVKSYGLSFGNSTRVGVLAFLCKPCSFFFHCFIFYCYSGCRRWTRLCANTFYGLL